MSKPQILLIHPVSGDWERMRSSPFLPLNVLHAATLAHEEFPVRVIDLRRDSDWRRSLDEAFRRPVAMVGITSMTGTMIASALEVAEAARTLDPGVKLIWGGMHASLLPEQTARHPLVDAVVVADGEEILLDLARRIDGGEPIEGTPGTVCVRDGEVIRGPQAALPDLDALPDPPFGLVDVAGYMPIWDGERSLSFESSRGCPRPCTFCYNTALNAGRFRMMSVERTVDRLAMIKRRWDPENVYVVDDNFLLDAPRGVEVGEGMRRLGMTWQLQGADIPSIARIDDATLAALARTGLKRISIGIESGSPRIRKRMKKSVSVDRVKKEIERLAQYDIVLYCSFFVGSPTEEMEDVRQTIDLVLDLAGLNRNFRNSPFYTYLPLPGTEMLDDAVAHGHRAPDSLEGWSRFTFDMESAFGDAAGSGPLSRKQTRALYFTSIFIDEKGRELGMPRLVTWLVRMYRPIARWRLRHMAMGFLVELAAYRIVHGLWMAVQSVQRRRWTREAQPARPAPLADRVPAISG